MGCPDTGISNLTILCVDDTPGSAQATVSALEDERTTVSAIAVSDPTTVLTRVKTESIDCILSEYDMAGFDGLELLELVRAEHPDFPFVLYTAAGSEEVASKAIRAGVDDYIPKRESVPISQLRDRVRAAVERRTSEGDGAHDSLSVSRPQLLDVLNSLEAAIFIKDLDGRYLFMNRHCRELIGVDEDEDIRGLTDADIFPSETSMKIRTDDQQVFERGETVSIEEDVPTPHGVRKHLTRKTPLFDPGGAPYAVCAVSTDITKQKEREEQLRERVKELSTIHNVVQEFAEYDRFLGDTLSRIVEKIPSSFQSPSHTASRITYGNSSVQTEEFEPREPKLTARSMTPDGTEITVEVTLQQSASNEAGELFLDSERDVLETLSQLVANLVHRNEQLSSLQRNETVLKALGDPVYALDRGGRFTYINDAMAELSGYDRSELYGEHVSALLPEDEERRGQALVEALVHDKDRTTARIEIDLLTAEGGRIPTETQIALLPPDENGRFRGTAGVARDITERKRREHERTRQRDFLHRTEQLASVGGWEYETETGEFEWTRGARKLHEVGPGFEPTFESVSEFYRPSDRKTLETAVEACRRDGTSFDLELRLTTVAGRDRWVNVRGELVEEKGSQLIRGTMQNLTDAKEREQQLMVLNRVLRHNLRNSLNVVTANAELVREAVHSLDRDERNSPEQPLQVADIVKKLDNIETHSLTLLRLSEKARRLSETIEGLDTTEPVDIPELFERAVDTYRRGLPDADISMRIDTDRVVSNAAAVEMILDELLDNAFRHTDSRTPSVDISVRRQPSGRTVIRVTDDGPGIPAEEYAALERGRETALEHGSGLGLWAVNWIVTHLGGSISITENEPRGTSVEVELPTDEP